MFNLQGKLMHSPPLPLPRSVCANRMAVPIPAECRLSVAELLWSLACRHGMTSRKTWRQQNHWPHFVTSSRHICSGSLFLTTLLDIIWLSPV